MQTFVSFSCVESNLTVRTTDHVNWFIAVGNDHWLVAITVGYSECVYQFSRVYWIVFANLLCIFQSAALEHRLIADTRVYDSVGDSDYTIAPATKGETLKNWSNKIYRRKKKWKGNESIHMTELVHSELNAKKKKNAERTVISLCGINFVCGVYLCIAKLFPTSHSV